MTLSAALIAIVTVFCLAVLVDLWAEMGRKL
jgi:hypothetical protein